MFFSNPNLSLYTSYYVTYSRHYTLSAHVIVIVNHHEKKTIHTNTMVGIIWKYVCEPKRVRVTFLILARRVE